MTRFDRTTQGVRELTLGLQREQPSNFFKRGVYIAGPISYDPERAYKVFAEAEDYLVARYPEARIVNPAWPRLGAEPYQEYDTYLQRALLQLLTCRSVMLLPGWMESRGACIEALIAKSLKMDMFVLTDDKTVLRLSDVVWSAVEARVMELTR